MHNNLLSLLDQEMTNGSTVSQSLYYSRIYGNSLVMRDGRKIYFLYRLAGLSEGEQEEACGVLLIEESLWWSGGISEWLEILVCLGDSTWLPGASCDLCVASSSPNSCVSFGEPFPSISSTYNARKRDNSQIKTLLTNDANQTLIMLLKINVDQVHPSTIKIVY